MENPNTKQSQNQATTTEINKETKEQNYRKITKHNSRVTTNTPTQML